MIKTFLQWFDFVSAVGSDVFIMIFKLLIPSSALTYIMWKKPGYYIKFIKKEADRPLSGTGILFSLLAVICLCAMIFSIFLLVVFTGLAFGL